MSLAVAAVVLAAGESSRMGRPKPLLPLGDETFLGHVLGQLRASRVKRTVVVLGHRPNVILEAMPEIAPICVVNERHALGQLSSLLVGLDALSEAPDAILLCLADHPFVGAEVMNRLIDVHEQTLRPVVIPTFEGRRGHPTLFARSVFGELRSAPLDQGARAVVRAHAEDLVEVPVGELGILADVDTTEQYEQWLERWKTRNVP